MKKGILLIMFILLSFNALAILPLDYSGLYALYRLDNETGMTVDVSSNSNTLTETGDVVGTAGLYNNAGEFDGNDYLLDSSGFNLNNASGYSFGGNFKFTSWTGDKIIIGVANIAENVYGSFQVTGANKFKFYGICSSNAFSIEITNVPSNSWVNIIGRVNTTSATIFYNGTQNVTTTITGGCDVSTDSMAVFTMGSHALLSNTANNYFWWTGLQDDIAVFNKPLTQNEITQWNSNTYPIPLILDIISPLSDNYNTPSITFTYNLTGDNLNHDCFISNETTNLSFAYNINASGQANEFILNFSSTFQKNNTYTINCDGFSDNIILAIDNVIPDITINRSSGLETGINKLLHVKFLAEDVYLYSFNLTTSNGKIINETINIDALTYTYETPINLSAYNFTPNALNTVTYQIWDSHTKDEIPKGLAKKNYEEFGIEFKKQKLKPLNKNNFEDFNFVEKIDRVSPRFKLKKKGIQTLNFEFSGNSLKEVLNTPYNNHFVDYSTKSWFDSDIIGHENAIYDNIKITDNKYILTITDDFQEDWIEFNSMGLLNNLTGTWTFYYGSSSTGGGGSSSSTIQNEDAVIIYDECKITFNEIIKEISNVEKFNADLNTYLGCLVKGQSSLGNQIKAPFNSIMDKIQELIDALLKTSTTSYSFS